MQVFLLTLYSKIISYYFCYFCFLLFIELLLLIIIYYFVISCCCCCCHYYTKSYPAAPLILLGINQKFLVRYPAKASTINQSFMVNDTWVITGRYNSCLSLSTVESSVSFPVVFNCGNLGSTTFFEVYEQDDGFIFLLYSFYLLCCMILKNLQS